MGYTIESPTPFGPSKDAKIMCVDTWDVACRDELNANGGAYSLVQFYRDIPRGVFAGLKCDKPLNVSVVGKEIADISGLQDCRPGVASLIIGLISKRAVEHAPLNEIVGLESLRVSYLDGVQLHGIHGSSVKKLVIDEIGGLKGPLDLSRLANLEHLRIMKLGTTPGVVLLESTRLKHFSIRDGKAMREVRLPEALRSIDYVSLEKVPRVIAEQLAQHSPLRVELEAKDIFKTKLEAQKVFTSSELLWG